MLNQVAVEALYSATYVENYLDSVDNLPDDVQRFLSRIREIDLQYNVHIRDIDVHIDQFMKHGHHYPPLHGLIITPAMAKGSRAIRRVQQLLILIQELGDEKIHQVTQLQELIEMKNRRLEVNFANLDYGKNSSAAAMSVAAGDFGLAAMRIDCDGKNHNNSSYHHNSGSGQQQNHHHQQLQHTQLQLQHQQQHSHNNNSSYCNSPASAQQQQHASPAHGGYGGNATPVSGSDRFHQHHHLSANANSPTSTAAVAAAATLTTKRPRRVRNDGGANSGETGGSGDNADTPLKAGGSATVHSNNNNNSTSLGSATTTAAAGATGNASTGATHGSGTKKTGGSNGGGGGGGGNGGNGGNGASASGANAQAATAATATATSASGSTNTSAGSNRKKQKRKSGRATGGNGNGGSGQQGQAGVGGSSNSSGGSGQQPNRDRDRDEGNTPPEDHIDPDEPTYCLCDQISFGEMILCDNDLCPIEWFHFSCVTLTTKPKGKWYCPNCRGDRSNVMKPKAQFLKELERYNKEKEEKT